MAKEYFPQIGKIPFEGTASKNPMAFHYYDENKVVAGKKMKDWLKFAMAWWHTLGAASGDQFGGQTRSYEWDKADSALQRAKDKMTQALKSWRSWASTISASTMWTSSTPLTISTNTRPT